MKFIQTYIRMRTSSPIQRWTIPFCTSKNKQSQQSTSESTFLTKAKSYSQLQCRQLLQEQNQLRERMLEYIDKFGEMKIEHYWRMALTDPEHGYYQNKNVFSKEGDFTTAPEVSPLFGEMIAIWIGYFLQKNEILVNGTIEKNFRIVELGPGRGLLMRDIIKSLGQLGVNNHFELCFIQVSEYNRKCQQEAIIQQFQKNRMYFRFEHQLNEKEPDVEIFRSEDENKHMRMVWVKTIEELLRRDIEDERQGRTIPFTIFLANQFFDAIPATVLEYTEDGWKEKVLKKTSKSTQNYFLSNLMVELGISNHQLPQKLRPSIENPKLGDLFQVSPQSLLTVDSIAKTILKAGGCLLNIDYGADASFSDSIRAIKDHKYIPSPYFWQIPGSCDLSAYVNFAALGYFAYISQYFRQKNSGIRAYEAIPQGYFLEAMGINPRIDMLSKNMDKEGVKRLESEYERLVLPSEMGEIYKVQIITKTQYGQVYPHISDKQNQF